MWHAPTGPRIPMRLEGKSAALSVIAGVSIALLALSGPLLNYLEMISMIFYYENCEKSIISS